MTPNKILQWSKRSKFWQAIMIPLQSCSHSVHMVTASYKQMMFNNARHFGMVDVRLREMQEADGRNLQHLTVSYHPWYIFLWCKYSFPNFVKCLPSPSQTDQNCMKEVNSRLNSGNNCYHLIQKIPNLGQWNIQQETESWSREMRKSQILQLRLHTLNSCILLCVASMQTEH